MVGGIVFLFSNDVEAIGMTAMKTDIPLVGSTNPITGISANGEDPDIMHNAAFHQGLHC